MYIYKKRTLPKFHGKRQLLVIFLSPARRPPQKSKVFIKFSNSTNADSEFEMNSKTYYWCLFNCILLATARGLFCRASDTLSILIAQVRKRSSIMVHVDLPA